MGLKKSLIISSILHVAIFAVLLSGIDWSWQSPTKNPYSIEARLIIKSKVRKKDLLPKKPKTPAPTEANEKASEQPAEKKPADQLAPVAKIAARKEEPKSKALSAKKDHDYTKELSSLSRSFAKELADKAEVVPDSEEVVEDSSYFDQIYTLIKESFVVPPHVNGPQGNKLQAVLRIFLASDGSLFKLDMESSSGDEHFDKAVMDGTRRVNNFGAVPIFLQNALRERGLVVELCPFKCVEH